METSILGGILLGILWIGGILFMRSITTFFHEMGHAIPALLFTRKEKVQVFIGSYGDISNALVLPFGRLILYLKLNVFNWRLGLCSHGKVRALIPRLIVILGGPLASLIIALMAFYYIISQEWSSGWVIFISFFIVSAIIDFLVNIDPSPSPIKLYNETITYTDGYQLLHALKTNNLPDAYFEAEALLEKGEPEAAVNLCLPLIDGNLAKKPVYDLIVKGLMAKKKYKAALDFYESFKGLHKYTYLDFYQIGFINLKLNRWDEALSHFDHCIYAKHTDALALNNRGYIRMQKGDYQRARQDLEAAVAYAPDFSLAYSNRGLLKVKMGEMEAGFVDLKIAQKIDPDSPETKYYLGLYHEEKRAFLKALNYFKEAKALGYDYHGLDLKIAETEGILDAFR